MSQSVSRGGRPFEFEVPAGTLGRSIWCSSICRSNLRTRPPPLASSFRSGLHLLPPPPPPLPSSSSSSIYHVDFGDPARASSFAVLVHPRMDG